MIDLNRKKIVFALILVVAAVGFAGAGEWKTATAGNFTLQWMVNGTNLDVKVSAPTEGWVAVGFDPSNMMKDANIIIGYVENGEAVIEDHFGNSPISHRHDTDLGGKDNLTNKKGTEQNGRTELSFTMPLNSGDPADRPLMAGGTYKVILASNSKDKITVKHNNRASVTITL